MKQHTETKSESSRLPLCAQLCNACAVVQVVATIAVLSFHGIGNSTTAVADPHEIAHFNNAKLMLLPAFLLEMCYVLSASANGHSLSGLEMSVLVVLEYAVKIICYSGMAQFDGALVHTNLRASGPLRACYTVRFIEWCIAVPMLLAINNYPVMCGKTKKEFWRRLAPNLVVTFTYIMASWVAQVTPDAQAGWFLVVLSFTSYALAMTDQVCIVLEQDSTKIMHYNFKLFSVIVKEVVFALYGLMYLLGCFNVVGSLTEQVFYTYSDVMLKVLQASCLVCVRNWEDLAKIRTSLEMQVSLGKEDISRLIGKASTPIFITDLDGRVTGWNEHLASLSRISAKEAVGSPIVDLVEESNREDLQEAVASCSKGLSTKAMEVTLVPPKGSHADLDEPVQLLMNFIIQFGGEVGNVVAIGQDLTELMAMKSLQERKARFTAIVSHELRSPLHGITGLTMAMAETVQDKLQKRQLEMINGCASRLLDLVTNIMEMADIDKRTANVGTQEAEPMRQAVNLRGVIDEVVTMTNMAIDKSGKPLCKPEVRLINNMSRASMPQVLGNTYKYTQLFYNLVTNACKFTTKGSVTLSWHHDQAKGMIGVDVEDTGKGIAPSALKRIFDPFEQEDSKDSRSFQGIGLGLSVAQGIAKLHNGEISVTSTVGIGSRFTVRLPCDDTVEAVHTPEVTEVEEPQLQLCQKMRMKQHSPELFKTGESIAKPVVLSVDDDDINQEIIDQALSDNFRVVRAMNGMQALEYLRKVEEMPSVVLLDVMMPGISGFDVCKEIRQRMQLGHLCLPVVMLSAKSPHEETAKECFQSGASDFMVKPFSTNMLKLRLGVVSRVQDELSIIESNAASDVMSMSATEAAEVRSASRDIQEASLLLEAKLAEQELFASRSLQELDRTSEESRTLREELDKTTEESKTLREALVDANAAALAAKAEAALAESKAEKIQKAEMACSSKKELSVAVALPQHHLRQQSTACMEAVWLRSEVEIRNRDMASLRKELGQCQTDAWTSRQRADALDRELTHVKMMMNQISFDECNEDALMGG